MTSDTVGISNGSLSTVLHNFAGALHKRAHLFIKFPNEAADIARTKREFYAIRGFPNVLGAIDCTHIGIIAPDKNIEADYVNR